MIAKYNYRILLLALLFSPFCFAKGSGTTVVINAQVYTLDPDKPWVEAFAYDSSGKILMVDTEAKILQVYGTDATVIDAYGDMVLPGFQDTHVHVPEAGINEGLCLLPAEGTLADYESLVADCAVEQAQSTWVRAAGVSLFNLRDTDELPIEVLDRAVPDRPVVILDDLGHAVWTNSHGLKAAGINADDPDPQGGVFHRHSESAALTGLLLEDAQQRVRNVALLDADTAYDGLLVALKELARNGVTSVSDAGGYWQQNLSEVWVRALKEDRLTVRAVNSLYLYPALDIDQQLKEFKQRFSNEAGSLLKFSAAKIYIDGILDLGTAAMIEPYIDPIDGNYPSGFYYFKADVLQHYVSALHAIGYQMNFHVIGDAAVRGALDSIQSIPDSKLNIANRRHRTTHTYLVHEDDMQRFSDLGVVADFQVGEGSIDIDYHEYLADFIGDRAFELLPVAKVLATGAHVSLSSDWDADPLSPFGIIEHALTRRSYAVDDLATAISLVTSGAAYALGHDDITGSIEVGKAADYVIVDQPLFDIDINDISETQVLMTVVGGKIVYESE